MGHVQSCAYPPERPPRPAPNPPFRKPPLGGPLRDWLFWLDLSPEPPALRSFSRDSLPRQPRLSEFPRPRTLARLRDFSVKMRFMLNLDFISNVKRIKNAKCTYDNRRYCSNCYLCHCCPNYCSHSIRRQQLRHHRNRPNDFSSFWMMSRTHPKQQQQQQQEMRMHQILIIYHCKPAIEVNNLCLLDEMHMCRFTYDWKRF